MISGGPFLSQPLWFIADQDIVGMRTYRQEQTKKGRVSIRSRLLHLKTFMVLSL